MHAYQQFIFEAVPSYKYSLFPWGKKSFATFTTGIRFYELSILKAIFRNFSYTHLMSRNYWQDSESPKNFFQYPCLIPGSLILLKNMLHMGNFQN